MDDISLLGWGLLAAVACAAFVLALLGPAQRFGLVDHPAGRKNHAAPTPLIGGLAMFLALAVAFALAGLLPVQSVSLMLAVLVTVGIGVADDAHEIGHRSKFFAQLVAALLIVSGTEVHVMRLGDLFGAGDVVLDKWSHLITVVSIIGLMNAINMIDGLDGLAGSQVLVALLVLAGVAASAGSPWALELAIVAGAVAGFLVFNMRSPWRPRARTFMGDTGGLLLGLLLAWYAVRLGGAPGASLRPITAVWIIAVPLLDMGAVMFLRMTQHKSPFLADRQHLHYVLHDAGLSVSQVVAMMAGLSIALSALALAAQAHGVPEAAMFVGFVALLLAYGGLLARPSVVARLFGPQARSVRAPD